MAEEANITPVAVSHMVEEAAVVMTVRVEAAVMAGRPSPLQDPDMT